ncbi:tripartite tricarboxylate transporter TctB family protein [Virgibacillus oceani]
MKKIANILFVVFLVIYGTTYYLEVLSQSKSIEDHAMITLIYFSLLILSIISVVIDIRKWTVNKENISIPWSSAKKPLIFLLLLTGYLILIPILGYFVSSLIFFVVVAYWLKSKKWKELLLVPVVLLIIVYFVFVVLLDQRIISGYLL